MTTKGVQSFRPLLPKIQLLINSTPSRVLPHEWSPKLVYDDFENKGPLVVKWTEKRAEKKQREPYPFGFLLNDIVRIQEKKSDNVVGRKVSRGIMSKEKFIITLV